MDKNDKDYIDFLNTVKNVNKPRTHKITNSIGTYDIYKLMRKNKWKGIGKPVTEKQFYAIISLVNKKLTELLKLGKEVIFPSKMGSLELRKRPSRIKIVDNQLITNLPVDWDSTMKLWYEDKESYDNKILVRFEREAIYSLYYNKGKASYNNKSYYSFRPTRPLKLSITRLVLNEELDAFLLYKND